MQSPWRKPVRNLRPLDGDGPSPWLDAICLKQREAGRIVSVAVRIALDVAADGRRTVRGMATGPSEAETFWPSFLRTLTRRGHRGGTLVVSDAHEGLEAAASKALAVTWQHCRVHVMRNAPAHVAEGQRQMVAALIRAAFAETDAERACDQGRDVADRLRGRCPRPAALRDEAEADVLAHMVIPAPHGPSGTAPIRWIA